MMVACVFCRIVAGEVPATKEYEDEEVLAFRDINPSAPIHVLVIPKAHIPSLNEASGHPEILGKLQTVASQLAKKLGIESGFKIVLNGGRFVEVPHLHYHLLGGWKEGGND